MIDRCVNGLMALSCVLIFTISAMADDPKPSQYAPADDLQRQVDYYVSRSEKTLADEKEFDAAKLRKDAHTLAVLALVLANHDTQNKFQDGALLKAAQQLATDSESFATATKAFEEVKKVAAANGGAKIDGSWRKAAALDSLMKQVPIVNNALKGNLAPKKFAKQTEMSAGQAATLAAIAQAVMFDDQVAKDAEALAKWQALCAEMRDSAAQINTAVRAGDQAGATAASKRLKENCDACHEKFRKTE